MSSVVKHILSSTYSHLSAGEEVEVAGGPDSENKCILGNHLLLAPLVVAVEEE